MPPALRSLGMNPRENHPPVSGCSFHDRGGSVRIPANNLASSGKLRAVFPIVVERWSPGNSNRHRRLADTLAFGRVETKLHTRSQVQTIVAFGEAPGQESARTDPEVVQAILHGAANVRSGA